MIQLANVMATNPDFWWLTISSLVVGALAWEVGRRFTPLGKKKS